MSRISFKWEISINPEIKNWVVSKFEVGSEPWWCLVSIPQLPGNPKSTSAKHVALVRLAALSGQRTVVPNESLDCVLSNTGLSSLGFSIFLPLSRASNPSQIRFSLIRQFLTDKSCPPYWFSNFRFLMWIFVEPGSLWPKRLSASQQLSTIHSPSTKAESEKAQILDLQTLLDILSHLAHSYRSSYMRFDRLQKTNWVTEILVQEKGWFTFFFYEGSFVSFFLNFV